MRISGKPNAQSRAQEALQVCERLDESTTYFGTSGSRKNSMNKYFKYREDAVRFVVGTLKRSALDSQLTMTITPAKSGGYSVSMTTVTSSDGTGMDVCCEQPQTT